MRIRYKPWARPELEASKFYIDNPEEYKGRWKEAFKKQDNELHLELGCGKGSFISQLAVKNHNINYNILKSECHELLKILSLFA